MTRIEFQKTFNNFIKNIPSFTNEIVKKIKLFAIEFFAVLRASFHYLSAYFTPKEYHYSKTDPRTTPIVFVHGFLHNSSAWNPMRKYLKREGWNEFYSLNLGHPNRSIEKYSDKLDKTIKKALEGRPEGSKIILIAHSMGGLVSLNWALRDKNYEKVEQVVAIGSPLHGTTTPLTAAFNFFPCVKEMVAGSAFTTQLNKKLEAMEAFPPVLTIGTPNDVIVYPEKNTRLDKHGTHISIEDSGHIALLFDSRVNQAIAKELNHPKAVKDA